MTRYYYSSVSDWYCLTELAPTALRSSSRLQFTYRPEGAVTRRRS